MRVVFATWDSGDTDYLASLFFPTFAALRERGIVVDTVQMTWASAERVAATRASAEQLGLVYRSVRVNAGSRKRMFPLNLLRFSGEIAAFARAQKADVVMPRAVVPAAAVCIARGALSGVRVVWDADGLPADERVDFAGWSRTGVPYRGMRAVERLMLSVADRVMVRTENARDILVERGARGFDAARIVVVPNGRDESVYRLDSEARVELRRTLNVAPGAPLLISVGSHGPQYLSEQQVRLVRVVLEADDRAKAVFLTAAEQQLDAMLEAQQVDRARVTIQRVPASEVPRWMAAADVGIGLRRASFSQRAVSPLKVSEYLLCGLPVVATLGVGDLDRTLRPAFSHIVDPDALDTDAFVDWVREVCENRAEYGQAARDAGVQYFGLDAMLAGYERLLA